MHVGLGRQLKEDTGILAEEDVLTDCSPSVLRKCPRKNFPEIVFLFALGVRKCHGCKGQTIGKSADPQKTWFFMCRHFEYGKNYKVQDDTNVMAMFIFT